MEAPLIVKTKYIAPSDKTYGAHKSNHITYIATNTKDEQEVHTFISDHGTNYADYMVDASKKELESGLFTYYGEADLKKAQNKIKDHSNIIYTSIISLREDDAIDLGYDDPQQWIDMLQSNMSYLLKQSYGFEYNNTTWYGAIHMKEGHPHAHIMFFENERVRSRNIFSEHQLKEFKKNLAKVIFKEKRKELFIKKDNIRQELKEITYRSMKEIKDKGLSLQEQNRLKRKLNLMRLKEKEKQNLNHLSKFSISDKKKLAKIIADGNDQIKPNMNLRYKYGTTEEKEIVGKVLSLLGSSLLQDKRDELFRIKCSVHEQYMVLTDEKKEYILESIDKDMEDLLKGDIYRYIKTLNQYNFVDVNIKKRNKYIEGMDVKKVIELDKKQLTPAQRYGLIKVIYLRDQDEGWIMGDKYEKMRLDYDLLDKKNIVFNKKELIALEELDIGLDINNAQGMYKYKMQNHYWGGLEMIQRQSNKRMYEETQAYKQLAYDVNQEARLNLIKRDIRGTYPPEMAEKIIAEHIEHKAVDEAFRGR